MVKIKVVDSMMGNGKTSWAIQNITWDNRGDKFLYVTPYLDEVDRVLDACKKVMIAVHTPSIVKGKGSKSEHLRELMKEGKNIVTTHALFDRIDEECLDIIRSQGYTLYMDEVHEVIKRHNMSDDDLKLLIESKYIEINGDTGKVEWIEEGYVGRFEEFRNLCKLGSMYKYSNCVYIWCFPVSIFKAMAKVYILTYYFEGQIQSAYYKLHNMEYKLMDVEKVGDISYKIVEYDLIKSCKDVSNVINLINIYEGKLNYEEGITLSSTWFDKADKATLKAVGNNILNYFQNIVKGKSNDNMWTTLKGHKDKLKGKGYSKGFVELNARATNKYKHKKHLAYVYNRFLNPIEKNFFISQGVKINEDLYALAELLQWIFRSQIREGKPINLYLPSKRMREVVFQLWKDFNKHSTINI